MSPNCPCCVMKQRATAINHLLDLIKTELGSYAMPNGRDKNTDKIQFFLQEIANDSWVIIEQIDLVTPKIRNPDDDILREKLEPTQ